MAAHRTRKRQLESGVELDMTPMIDIVFLLIAFFMIVSDLSQLNIQPVILPRASEAKVQVQEVNDRQVIINVVRIHETGLPGIRLGASEQNLKWEELAELLKADVEEYGIFETNPTSGKQDSMLKVLVRCDEGAKSGAIHEVYKACQAAKIFRVSIGAVAERLGNPYSH